MCVCIILFETSVSIVLSEVMELGFFKVTAAIQ